MTDVNGRSVRGGDTGGCKSGRKTCAQNLEKLWFLHFGAVICFLLLL